jgi:hypothetical protein
MSEKRIIKTNKRKTSRKYPRKYPKKTLFMVRNLKELINIMTILVVSNKNPVFNDIIDKTSNNIEEFINQYSQLPKNKVAFIENDISKVIYNRTNGMKAKLFGYIELINDFRIYLTKEKYTNLLQICDEINENLQHFILILNDTSYRTNQVT